MGIMLKSVKAMNNFYRSHRFFTMKANLIIHSKSVVVTIHTFSSNYVKTFHSQVNNVYLKLKDLFLYNLVLQNLSLTNCFFSLQEFQYHQFHYYPENLYMNINLWKIISQLHSDIGFTLLILVLLFLFFCLQLQVSNSNIYFFILEIVYIVCYLHHYIALSNTSKKPFFTMVLLLILTKIFSNFFFQSEIVSNLHFF